MPEVAKRIGIMENRIKNSIAITLAEYKDEFSQMEILFALQKVFDDMSKKADLRIEVA